MTAIDSSNKESHVNSIMREVEFERDHQMMMQTNIAMFRSSKSIVDISSNDINDLMMNKTLIESLPKLTVKTPPPHLTQEAQRYPKISILKTRTPQ